MQKIPPIVYSLPYNDSVKGLPFNVIQKWLQELSLSSADYISLTTATVEDFVFVSGISKEYFNKLKNTVGTVQHFRPQNKIVVYDLGLTKNQVGSVRYIQDYFENFHVEKINFP